MRSARETTRLTGWPGWMLAAAGRHGGTGIRGSAMASQEHGGSREPGRARTTVRGETGCRDVMNKAIRNRQALAVLVNGFVAVGAVGAAMAEQWALVVITLAAMLLLLTVLTAHNHHRVGETWRLAAREAKRRRKEDTSVADTVDTVDAVALTDVLVASVNDSVVAALRHGGTADEQLLTRLDLVERTLSRIGHSLVAATGRLEERARWSTDEIEDRFRQHDHFERRWSDDIEGLLERLNTVQSETSEQSELLGRLRHEPVTEIDAMLQLHRRFPFEGPVPLMFGWALSPRGLLQLVDICEDQQPRLVVECGSGTSTLFVAAALKQRPGARLVALEHLEDIATRVADVVHRQGLNDVVDVRFAPLVEVEVEGKPFQWYDPAQWADLEGIDLLLVDGPPGTTGPRARYPAFPMLQPRLAAEATVVLDDAQRDDEAHVRRRWLRTTGLEPVRSMTNDQALLRWTAPSPDDVSGDPPVTGEGDGDQ